MNGQQAILFGEVTSASGFDEFWRLYPRKVAKLEAVKAWKQVTREYAPADIIAGLERNLPTLTGRDRQYVKHPASWLRAGCWMDEPEHGQVTGNGLIDALFRSGATH